MKISTLRGLRDLAPLSPATGTALLFARYYLPVKSPEAQNPTYEFTFYNFAFATKIPQPPPKLRIIRARFIGVTH